MNNFAHLVRVMLMELKYYLYFSSINITRFSFRKIRAVVWFYVYYWNIRLLFEPLLVTLETLSASILAQII
jgi:hypothetical protein